MREWYGCRVCGHDEPLEDWDKPPFCPYCGLEHGELNEMEAMHDEDDFEPPTVRNEVV